MNEFDYEDFKNSLLGSEDWIKNEIMSTYLKNYGSNPLEKEPFFTEYLVKFPPPIFNIPVLDTSFNWMQFSMLICGSFSCQYYFKYAKNGSLPDLILEVNNGSESLIQSIADIDDSYKIKRLLEIYIEEQYNLSNLLFDNEEKFAVEIEREERIDMFQKKIEKLDRERFYREHLNSSRNKIRLITGINKGIPF